LTEITCCYDLECEKRPVYWVKKKDSFIQSYWYPLCQEHLEIIIENSEIEIIALKTERVRKFEYKIFCSKLSHNSEFENWKMFIDWEEIASELDMDKPITFEVYRALQKYYHNNYLKIKKRIENKRL